MFPEVKSIRKHGKETKNLKNFVFLFYLVLEQLSLYKNNL